MTQTRLLSPALWGLLAALLLAVPLSAATAEREIPIRAAGPGELITTLRTDKKAEIVHLDEGLAPSLLKVKLEESVRIPDWPIAPDRRAEVRLTRREIYARGARVFSVEAQGPREVPRSRRVFLWGEATGEDDTRVMVSIDPADRMIRGFSLTHEGIHELRPLGGRSGRSARQHLVAPPDVFLDDRTAEAVETQARCDQEHSAVPSFLQQSMVTDESDSRFLGGAITSLHTITVAVETDNELLSLKFSNNTTSASNYLAELFAAMNVIYERDLKIRLLQGTTFLRPSTTADPYNQPVSASTYDKLLEFGNYWRATYGGVTRGLAMMLSGKQSSNNSSSGIAWLNGLCSTSYGYSFSQVFKFAGATAANDTLVVAHEIGHNFGSPHTHCYSPPIDNCYNGEGGCYTGTRSCPAAQMMNGVPNVTGTLMSYCHLSGISGCTSSKVFHPTSVSLLNPKIDAKVGACIFPAAPAGPTVTAVNPKSGTTAGGTPVTITGTNFQSGATVTFGGTAASSVVVASATTITAVTPAKPTGTVAVAVTNPGGQVSTLTNGFFYAPPPSANDFYTVTPCRVLDTRNATGQLGGPALSANQVRTFTITGTCGVPAGAKAVAVNLTTVTPGANGFLQAFPGNAFPLGTSTVSFRAGQVRASSAVLTLATNGSGTLGVKNESAGGTHLVLDVVGYFQ